MSKSSRVFLSVMSVGVVVAVAPSVTHAQSLQSNVNAAVNTAKTVAAPVLLKQAKSDFHQTIVNEREQMQQQMQQAKTEFQQKLALIKDQKKQQRVENINTHIQTINEKQTDRMSQALDSLSTILTKIEEQRDALATQGATVTVLNADITAATQDISTAKIAVTAQATKSYSINIVDDTTLKTTVGATVSQFRADMTTTYKSVIDAKQAVVKAAQALKVAKASTHNSSASDSAGVQE